MIAVIDYGLGNVAAFLNVYKRFGIPARAVSSPDQFAGATRLVLPGVGAFDHAMERLNASGLRDEAARLVERENLPVLGVCVGMQMLAQSSAEGSQPGLGWVDGEVLQLDAPHQPLPLPHMGWNDVSVVSPHALFRGLESAARFYFLHSYCFRSARPEAVLAETGYGQRFHSAVFNRNVFGVQFHPEKSHAYGATLLKNFAELEPC